MDPMTGMIIALYLLPALVAFMRGAYSKWGIMILNVTLGWTLLGWIVALVWSASARRT